MNFAQKLQQIRKERGMSQEQLAEVIGVSRQAISKWESGTAMPDSDNLVTISNYFGVTIDSLLKPEPAEQGEQTAQPAEQATVTKQSGGLISALSWHYEYKSKRTVKGVPLVHINIGFPFYKAKGIIAIGNAAVGVVSLGLASMGVLSWGLVSLGVISLALMSLGILSLGSISLGLVALGGVAIGGFAMGGVAIGYVTMGGASIGVYSVGGAVSAKRIAIGGAASGTIAIGDEANGEIAIENFVPGLEGNYEYIKAIILSKYPKINRMILEFMLKFV